MKHIFTPSPTQCTRCWQCCVEAFGRVNPWMEKQFVLPWQWVTKEIRICPLMGVDDGLPFCLIHSDGKPDVCKKYHCILIQSHF